jgi:hypothetical protein
MTNGICHHAAMKKIALYIVIVLSLLVLGAHFLRDGNSVGVAAALGLQALLFVRAWWVARLVQLALVLGSVEWLWTAYQLAAVRAAHGQPFLRMTVILGVVAAVTLAAALAFQSPTLRKVYRLDGRE